MQTRRTLALALVAAALVALPAASAHATTIVGCTGTPLTDGTNLINAYGSATAPDVVQPSPCDYNLGTSTLTLRDGVDLVGLSRNTTLIRSQNNTAGQGTLTVPSNVDVEVRNLAIETDSQNAVAIDNSSSLLVVEDVNATATGEENATAVFTDARMRGFDLVLRADVDGEEVITAIAIGIDDDSGSVFSDTLVIAGGAACTDATGIILDNSDATLDEVSVFVTCGGDATGIEVLGGSGGSEPLIANLKVFASSTNGDGFGIATSGADNFTRVRDALIEVTGDENAYGLHKTGALTLQLVDVQALAFSSSNNVGLEATAGLTTADRSTLLGDTGGAAFNVGASATGRFAVSKLAGSRGTTGTTTCVGNYDGAYAAITSTTC